MILSQTFHVICSWPLWTPGIRAGRSLWQDHRVSLRAGALIRVCLHTASKLPKIYSSQRDTTYLTAKYFCFQQDRVELNQKSGVSAMAWLLAKWSSSVPGSVGVKGSWGVLQAKWVPQEFNTCSVQILHQQSKLGKGEYWREAKGNHFITDFISS